MQEKSSRLIILDIFRGVCALLVVWQHFGVSVLKQNNDVPIFIKWFFWIIGNQGGLAVYFFFALAGFLMVKIYPTIDDLKIYYLKRLGRIFPVYLLACFVFSYYKFYRPNFVMLMFWMSIFAIFLKYSWRFFMKTSKRQNFFLVIFVLTTIFTIFTYFSFLHNEQLFSNRLQSFYPFFVFLVNGTIAFGWGEKIEVVNLVFWSMGMEIIFYMIYPFLNIIYIKPILTKRLGKIQLFSLSVSVFILNYLLISVFSQLFNFKIFRFEGFIFFWIGIFWGIIFAKKTLFEKPKSHYSMLLVKLIFVAYFLFMIFLNAYYIVIGLAGFNENLRLLLSIPVVLIFFGYLLSINEKIKINYFLMKIGNFIGKISYPLYLFHFFIYSVFIDLSGGMSAWDFYYDFLSYTFLSIALAFIIHYLLENDYFEKIRFLISYSSQVKVKLDCKKQGIIFFVTIQLLIFPLFRNVDRSDYVVVSPVTTKRQQINEAPVSLNFNSNKDGLGSVGFRLMYDGYIKNGDDLKMATDLQIVKFELFDFVSGQSLALTNIPSWGFGKTGNVYWVGFPVQSDSKNAKYQINISALDSSKEKVYILPTKNLEINYANTRKFSSNLEKLVNLVISLFTNPNLYLSKPYLLSILNLFLYLIVKKNLVSIVKKE